MDKVYLRVEDSDIFYRYLGFKFYFSSRATRDRFIKRVEKYVFDETTKFINKYDLLVDEESFNIMYAFSLYNKIEKRGIKIEKLLDKNESIVVKRFLEIPTFSIYGYGGD